MKRFTALVLAGRRGRSDALADALAESDASGHHALIDVGGVPMLLRVVRTLRASPSIGRIVISIDDPAQLESVPELFEGLADGSLVCHTSLDSPSRSVLDALERMLVDPPLLVATADHALLTPDMVEHVVRSDRGDDDVLVAAVAATLIRAHYPESTRTYLKFRDDGYSGANLFAFVTPQAKRAVEFWVRAERFRKRPWKLVSVFGPVALLLFLLRRLDFDAAIERVSRVIGVRVRGVRMPFAEAAIDVDRPSDLALVRRILAERESRDESRPVGA